VAGNPTDAEAKAKEQFADKQRTPTQIDNAARATVSAAEKHFASQSGDAPGWVKEASNGFKERRPERNWPKELAHVVRRTTGLVKAGGADFSMARPSRRSTVFPGVVRPGMVEQEVEVAIFWDTSGSMGTPQLNKARQVTMEVLRQMGIDSVLMAQGDTKIQMDFQRVRLKDIPEMDCNGRGGTNFNPVFSRLAELKPKPDLIMIVSDGDGPAPSKPPPATPVVWVIVPAPWSRRPTTWGHYVICSNDHDEVDKVNG
jgi:predicted metal-dependent peptidase